MRINYVKFGMHDIVIILHDSVIELKKIYI